MARDSSLDLVRKAILLSLLLLGGGTQARASAVEVSCELVGRVLKAPVYKGIVEEKIPLTLWIQSVRLVHSSHAPRPLCPFRPGEVIEIEAEIGEGVDRKEIEKLWMVSLTHHRIFDVVGQTLIWRIDSVAAALDKPYPPREISMPAKRRRGSEKVPGSPPDRR